jgi:hypothetical protein
MAQMNSFQKWARDCAREFGFHVTPCGNWVKLHRDGAEIECMSAKGVQLACCSPAARLKVFSLVIDNDSGTAVELFTSEAARDARCRAICAEAWGEIGPAMPNDWRDAYAILSDHSCDFWLATQEHDLALPLVLTQLAEVAA